MTSPCHSKWKKQGENKRSEKSTKKATKTCVDQNGNIIERIMSRGEESASATQAYYENRAQEAINNFDTACGQASGSHK